MTDIEPHTGIPFEELAETLGVDIPSETDKKVAGRIKAAVLGPRAYNGPLARCVGLDPGYKVREHLTIAGVDFDTVLVREFADSGLSGALDAIVLVPVMKMSHDWRQWYFRRPILWETTSFERAQFAQDYAATRDVVRNARLDQLSAAEPPAGQGRYLTTNTGGQNAADSRLVQIGAQAVRTKPRKWYIRKSVVQRVFDASRRDRPRLTLSDVADDEDDEYGDK